MHSVVVNTTDTGGEFGHHTPFDAADAADRFLVRARVDDAVRERRRRSASADRALDEVVVTGSLLGAHGTQVSLCLASASVGSAGRLSGTVGGVGADVVELIEERRVHWVALETICAVETTAALTGDPADRDGTSLAELVADLIDSGARPSLLLTSGVVLTGEVIAVGSSLLIRLADPVRHAVVVWEHLIAVTVRRHH